jgi:hypothetical protein
MVSRLKLLRSENILSGCTIFRTPYCDCNRSLQASEPRQFVGGTLSGENWNSEIGFCALGCLVAERDELVVGAGGDACEQVLVFGGPSSFSVAGRAFIKLLRNIVSY